MRSLQFRQRLDFHRGMADDREQSLVAPDVALQWRDVEVANHDGRLGKTLRPARHAIDEVEFLPELPVLLAVRDVAAGGDIDIFEPDSAFEPRPDVARLAIVLPVVLAGIRERNAAENCDAM